MYFSSLGGWLSSLISRHCKDLIVSPKRSLKAVVGIEMDPIYISDSDSDIEDITGIENSDSDIEDITGIENSDSDIEDITDIEASRGSGTSIDHRVLPSWMSMSGTNSRNKDDGGLSRKVCYSKRASSLNGSSVYACHHPQDKIQIGPFSGDSIRSSKHTAQAYDSKYSMENGNSGLLRSITSQNSDMSGIDYGKYSSQQALKRALPPSLRTFPSSFHPSKSSYSGDYVAASQIHNTGNSYQSVGSRLTNGKGYMTDHISSGSANGVFMNENSGHRNLPPSLMHVKSALPTQIASSSNLGHHSESAAGHDERLIFQAALEDLNQPKSEATLPKGLLSVSLLRHQKIALAWMLQKETRSLHCLGGILADDQGLGKTISMISLIQMQRSLQEDFKKEHLRNTKTEALNLEDDDGSAGLNKVEQTGDSDDIKMIPEVSTSIPAFSRRRQAAGTLVVCPASILRQWARELDEKVAKEAKFSVLIYHGGSRTKDPIELAKYDVVLTTYAIVTNEVPKQSLVKEDGDEKNGEKYGLSSDLSFNNKRKKKFNDGKKRKKGRNAIDSLSIDYGSGPLARVGWFRVILDEAQTIKNHKTQVSRACCSLRAKRRWCLSGTPLQNTIDDLYSYFRFLRYDPYASYKSFYLAIKLPVSRDSVQGYKKLQAVLRAIMLRRTKGTLLDGEPIINLPPKSICLTKVDFPGEERAFYDKLEADSRSQFKAYAAAGTVNQNYANILLMLLRLRQACDHPLLVKGFNSDRVGKVSLEMAKCLPPDMVSNLLSLLETSSAICHVCSDPPEDAVVTMCGHVFCCQCVSEYLTCDDNTCPAPGCKEHLGSDVVFSKATLRSCSSDDFDRSLLDSSQSSEKLIVLKKEYISSKIRAAIEILQSHCKVKSSSLETEGSTKAIVFSQWTRMLDLVENSLKESSLQYRRLDGTMTLGLRDRAVRDFNTNPEVTVMLMSLKAGNLGLNMIAASHVIILDLWWNPTTEDQAIDRAHRIGQTRPVTVSRLTISNTVEDRILALQEQKRKMVASAFGEEHSGGSATRLTVDDLRYLFMV